MTAVNLPVRGLAAEQSGKNRFDQRFVKSITIERASSICSQELSVELSLTDPDLCQGREGSKYCLDDFLEIKCLCMSGMDA